MDHKNILIVEDEPLIAKAYGDGLKQAGYNVEFARNGLEGLKMAQKISPDLIFLDVQLPAIDGMTVLKKIKSDPQIAYIPVFILSNIESSEKIADSIEYGGMTYLIKTDHDINDILDKVKKALESS